MTTSGTTEGDDDTQGLWPRWLVRALGWAMVAAWLGFAGLLAVTLVSGLGVKLEPQVACRLPDGPAMLFRPGGGPKGDDPTQFRFSSYVLGSAERPRSGQIAAARLDCDPRHIQPNDLKPLTNVAVTSLRLSTRTEGDAVQATLAVDRSFSGTDTYHWTWRDGKIEAASGTGDRSRQGMMALFLWLLVSLAPTVAVLRQRRLRRRLGADAPAGSDATADRADPAGRTR